MNIADQVLKLQDEAREHQAIALGKRIEIAMLKGQRKAAEQFMRQMNGITALRRASKFAAAESKGECFFVTAGEAEGLNRHA